MCGTVCALGYLCHESYAVLNHDILAVAFDLFIFHHTPQTSIQLRSASHGSSTVFDSVGRISEILLKQDMRQNRTYFYTMSSMRFRHMHAKGGFITLDMSSKGCEYI